MEASDELIQKHLAKVAEAQLNADDGILTLEDLKQINMELGVTEQQWEQLMQESNKLITLAKDHLIYRNFQDAMSAVDQALALNPFVKGGFGIKAKASLMLYLEIGSEKHKTNAREFANEALKRDSKNKLALEVLSSLNASGRTAEVDKTQLKKIISVVVGVFILVALGAFFMLGTSNDSEDVKIELITAEENVNSAFAQLMNVYKRKTDLVPSLLKAFEVTQNKKEEIELLTNDAEVLSGGIQDFIKNQTELSNQLNELIENSSTKDQSIQTLLIQLEGAENRISVERKKYNEAVKAYNMLVKTKGENYPEFKLKSYIE